MKRFSTLILVSLLAVPAIAAEDPKTAAGAKPAATPAKAEKAPEAAMVKDKAMDNIDKQIAAAAVNKSAAGWKMKLKKPVVAEFDKTHDYYARMETNKGTIVIKFLPEVAPMHVTSFAYLTKLGYYDGLSFHRVITGFMAQGGCPMGTGTGGPGYEFGGEFSETVKHTKGGLLSMANAGPGTDGSQFFITFKATPWLDGKHTIFGEVVEGMDVVKKLEASGSQSGQPSEPLSMTKVTVEVKAKKA
jgi:cyclophilin family peptidyl-prolyl cis-trans isomerase